MRGHLLDLPAVGAPNATYLGEVVAVNDPKNLGRVQLRLLSFDGPEGHDAPVWARVAFPFAGNERGAFFLPDVGDEVLVSFVNGDSRFPVVIGSFYHGNAGLPETLGGNGDRVDRWTITGKAGSRIAIVEEQSGRPTISLTTPGGVEITLTDDGSKIRLKTTGSSIEIEPSGIKVKTSGKVEVNASEVEITSGQVTVNSALSNFSGVVKCDVMQATTVIATTYTPGAGNIW